MTGSLLAMFVLTAPAASDSKLGVHMIDVYTPGTRRIIAAGPRVLKVLDPRAHTDVRQAIRDFKARVPDGIVVMRVWEGTPDLRYSVRDDPHKSADDFWSRVLAPAVDALAPDDRKRVDFLEGPNEGENTPTWESVEAARWFAAFWVRLAEHIARAGFRPCVGSIAVGNPPGNATERAARLEAFVPALRAAKKHAGVWSYHAYSIGYTTDADAERWHALRYRQVYAFLRTHHPALADLPVLLTEAGIDRAGNPRTDGWQARGDAERYRAWLRWFDDELRRDPQVLGATLFAIGNPHGWPSFDLEPIAGWLAGHIARPRKVGPKRQP